MGHVGFAGRLGSVRTKSQARPTDRLRQWGPVPATADRL